MRRRSHSCVTLEEDSQLVYTDNNDLHPWVGYTDLRLYMMHIKAPTDYARERLKMTLIVPNTQHPKSNNNDLIFCLPVTFQKWNKWKALSDAKSKTCQGVSFYDRVEEGKTQTILFLPEPTQTDDDVLTAAAYMRMIDNITCRMYVIRATFSEPTSAQRAFAVIGADPDTIIEVPDEPSEGDSDD